MVPSDADAISNWYEPSESWTMSMSDASRCVRLGRLARATSRPFHDHVLRNQMVGSRCNRWATGPRFATWTRITRSSGDALAYSIVMSK